METVEKPGRKRSLSSRGRGSHSHCTYRFGETATSSRVLRRLLRTNVRVGVNPGIEVGVRITEKIPRRFDYSTACTALDRQCSWRPDSSAIATAEAQEKAEIISARVLMTLSGAA